MRDYNSLPPESNRFPIHTAYATNSSIMKTGFEHFKGCSDIETVILHSCKHLEEDGLDGLIYLENSLKNLQVSECLNINDDGLKCLKNLKGLQNLNVFGMSYVDDLKSVITYLQKELPSCNITATL